MLLADRALTRRELSVELFPDAADPLGSLRWCLASLRKAIGSAEVLTGDPVLRELPDWVSVDVYALRDGAVDLANIGELLEGVDPPCGPEFATWLLVARQQVSSRIAAHLRDATIKAISRNDHERAVELAELAARRSPYDEGAQVLLAKALVAAGHQEAALEHVVSVEALYRDELGCDPTPALRSAARAGVAAPPPGLSPGAVAASLLGSGRAALSAGAVEAGLDCLRRAGAQAEAADDSALHGQCLFELGSALVHAVRGFDDEGSVLLEQALHLAQTVGDLPTAVGALRERAYADTLAGRRPEAHHQLSLALELADGAPALLPGLHAVSGMNLADWGRPDDGLEHYEAAIDVARSVGDRRWEGWAFGLGGWAAMAAGRLPQAKEWLGQCLDVVHELQWMSFEPWPMTALAEAHLTERSRSKSPDDLERCFATSCQLEDPCWEGASGRVLALHYAQADRSDDALSWITDARRRALRRSDTWVAMIGVILLTEAQIRQSIGDTTGANVAARELVAFAARAQLDQLLEQGLAITHATT
ncbi:MAG: bacterial transcriptional activator domain-containing protein [Acidimicrobiia bacterium]|nr:bacterial transcriptional activator domain-containing protein [Acidimicrobiia bacterium]